MPKATVSNATEKFDLKSCEGGFVELKRMTYGQYLERRDMAIRMEIGEMGGSDNSPKATMDTSQKKVALFELKNCVVDHNLEDDEGKKLNFGSPQILSVLDPRIGNEIGDLIDEMNAFQADPKD